VNKLYKIFVCNYLIIAACSLSAQVKIGDNPTSINPNAVLEIESTNQGVLMPRVALISSTNPTPLTAHIAGMTVYNISSSMDITPGFYYNDGAKWVKLGQNLTTVNGLNLTPDNAIKLGGPLTQPTTIGTGGPNTLAITGLGAGDINTDEFLTIDPVTGVIKKTPVSGLTQEIQSVVFSSDGQTQFLTPMSITNINKINVYRNGARIGATIVNANTIALEAGVVCVAGDEIRIVQFN
jgi:hypothetical protein